MPPKRKGQEPLEPCGPGSKHLGSIKRCHRERNLEGNELELHRARTADRTAKSRAVRRLRATEDYGKMSATTKAAAEIFCTKEVMAQ